MRSRHPGMILQEPAQRAIDLCRNRAVNRGVYCPHGSASKGDDEFRASALMSQFNGRRLMLIAVTTVTVPEFAALTVLCFTSGSKRPRPTALTTIEADPIPAGFEPDRDVPRD